VAIFLALMIATAGIAIWPALARLTAPLVCPDGSVASEVVVDSDSSPRGGVATSTRLFCIDASRRPVEVDWLKVMAVLFGECAVVLTGLGLVTLGIAALARRSRVPGPEEQP
jgi:hypothetical protein